jgi:hypothetical protein
VVLIIFTVLIDTLISHTQGENTGMLVVYEKVRMQGMRMYRKRS